MTKVFFIGDTSNRLNWGCRATTAKLRELIGRHGTISATLDLKRPFEPFENNSLPPETVGPSRAALPFAAAIKSAVLGLSPRLLAMRPGWIESAPTGAFAAVMRDIHRWPAFERTAEAMRAADAVIINGEGSFLRNRGRYCLLMAHVTRQLGKPVAMVNHVADFRDPRLRAVAELTYPHIDDTVVRDPRSLEAAAPLRVGKRHGFAADAAFLWKPDTAHISRCIVVGGSAAYNHAPERWAEMTPKFEALCRALMPLGEVVVTGADGPDDAILRPVAERLGLRYFGPETPTQEAANLLGNASLHVGGRWHPSILALTGGTPLVMLDANSDFKSGGLLELVGLEQEPLSAFDLPIARIVELAKQRMEDAALRERLLARVAGLKATVEDNVRLLRR